MHVLLVTPEVAPLVVATERANAVSGLTRALCAAGAELTVVAPALHDSLHQQHALARRLQPLRFTLDGAEVEVTLLEGKLAGSAARVLLLDHESFGALSPDATDSNDASVFATFARAALQVTVDLALGVDLIHAHDWQTALLPLLAHRLTTEAEIRDLPVVFSVHCLDLPGQFHPDAITQASWFDDQNEDLWTIDGASSLLYTGTLFADAVTTDSSAAADLLAERLGHSELPPWMASRLARQPPIAPIVPGLDYEQCSSASSRHIAAHYTGESIAPKQICKADLLERIGLAARPNTPLVATLSSHRGADLLLERADELAATGIQVAFLGQASTELAAKIEKGIQAYPQLFAALPGGLDDAALHRVLAGADALFVLPSGKDIAPTVLRALAFGTIPITRASGGVGEIVVDYDPPSATGTALLLGDDTAAAALTAIHRLCAVYQSELHWRGLQRTAMSQRFNWSGAATQHLDIYRYLLAEAPSEIASPA